MIRRCTNIITCLGLMAFAAPSYAGEPEARRAYFRARDAYEKGRDAEALAALQRARAELGSSNIRLDSLELALLARMPDPDLRRLVTVRDRLARALGGTRDLQVFAAAQPAVTRARAAVKKEDALFARAQASERPMPKTIEGATRAKEAYDAYLKAYPKGAHSEVARKRSLYMSRLRSRFEEMAARAARARALKAERASVLATYHAAMAPGAPREAIEASLGRHAAFLQGHAASKYASSVRTHQEHLQHKLGETLIGLVHVDIARLDWDLARHQEVRDAANDDALWYGVATGAMVVAGTALILNFDGDADNIPIFIAPGGALVATGLLVGGLNIPEHLATASQEEIIVNNLARARGERLVRKSELEASMPVHAPPRDPGGRRACQGKTPEECNELGVRLEHGRDIAKDEGEALSRYREACSLGLPKACMNFGLANEFGRATAPDVNWAYSLYQSACMRGDPRACYRSGHFVDHKGAAGGGGVLAEFFYSRGCEAGSALSCNDLGVLYERGDKVPRDVEHAASLYERACEAGSLLACDNYGAIRFYKFANPWDKGEAREVWRKNCEQGFEKSCGRL